VGALAKSVGQPCARKSHARLEEGAPVGHPGEDTQAPPTERGGNSYGLATATSDRALLYRAQLRCWHDRQPYDEARHLLALQKRHSPIIALAAQST
jgi:hypothetical protein